MVIEGLLLMSPGPPRRQPDGRRGEAAARTAAAGEGKPRTKAGAGSPKGNTGRRAAGCGPTVPSQEGLEKEMGMVPPAKEEEANLPVIGPSKTSVRPFPAGTARLDRAPDFV